MAERADGVLTELAHLAPVGTPERREWDRTIREVNELYPDWSAIHVGKALFRRETYEQQYKRYYEGEVSFPASVVRPGQNGRRTDPRATEARPRHPRRERRRSN
jgi:hypothetical protein